MIYSWRVLTACKQENTIQKTVGTLSMLCAPGCSQNNSKKGKGKVVFGVLSATQTYGGVAVKLHMLTQVLEGVSGQLYALTALPLRIKI